MRRGRRGIGWILYIIWRRRDRKFNRGRHRTVCRRDVVWSGLQSWNATIPPGLRARYAVTPTPHRSTGGARQTHTEYTPKVALLDRGRKRGI